MDVVEHQEPGETAGRAAGKRNPAHHRSGISPALLLLIWVALLIYRTLLPFNFDRIVTMNTNEGRVWRVLATGEWPAWQAREPATASSLGIDHALSDLATNVLLFVPVGSLIGLVRPLRRAAPLIRVAAAACAALVMSWTIESVQSLTVDRVSSLQDVAANTAGAMLGALIAVPTWHLARQWIFKLFCHTSPVLHAARRRIVQWRRSPVAILGATLLVALPLIASAGYADTAAHKGHGTNWLPFMRQFEHSYDVAALQITG